MDTPNELNATDLEAFIDEKYDNVKFEEMKKICLFQSNVSLRNS